MSAPKMLFVASTAMMVMGCAESAILAGNGVSMLVASALLWSTVNIRRQADGEEQP